MRRTRTWGALIALLVPGGLAVLAAPGQDGGLELTDRVSLVERGAGIYDVRDAGPFNPSTAIYFMDGYSDATVRVYATGEVMTFKFWDRATCISATAPVLPSDPAIDAGIFLVAPRPLESRAEFPKRAPREYRRASSLQLLQVISMNMASPDGKARLLIGLPYAEKYPKLFSRADTFADGGRSAASYGAVASLTEFRNPFTRRRTALDNGYPARSLFAVYHILETPFGAFFNKKPTVMELQPGVDGKLALYLPPVPFKYELINGPIPLYDVNNPDGQAMAEIMAAHHNGKAAAIETLSSWPWHQPELRE